VPAGAFDDAGEDRPALTEGMGIVETDALVAEVVGGDVGTLALLG